MPNFYRGCPDIVLRFNGEYSDSDLIIDYLGDTYVFNYGDVEGDLWDEFLAYEGIDEAETFVPGSYVVAPEWDAKFDEYCKEYTFEFMIDLIIDGYFTNSWDPYEEEYSWHQLCRSLKCKNIYYELEALLDSDTYSIVEYFKDAENAQFSRKDKIYYIDSEPIGNLDALESYLWENEPDWDTMDD